MGKMRGFTSRTTGRRGKRTAKKLEDIRSPLAFLLGKTKLEKELQGLSLAPDIAPLEAGRCGAAGGAAGSGGPDQRDFAGGDAGTPDRAIVIDEVDGAVTEYRFAIRRKM